MNCSHVLEAHPNDLHFGVFLSFYHLSHFVVISGVDRQHIHDSNCTVLNILLHSTQYIASSKKHRSWHVIRSDVIITCALFFFFLYYSWYFDILAYLRRSSHKFKWRLYYFKSKSMWTWTKQYSWSENVCISVDVLSTKHT